MDHKILTARPFKFNDRKIKELELKLINKTHVENMAEFTDQIVKISGFIVYNANNEPLRLDVDHISLKTDEDDQYLV